MFIIDSEKWLKCKICGALLGDMEKPKTKKSTTYRCEKFLFHLMKHDILPEEYFLIYENIEIPYCKCGCGTRLKIVQKGKNILYRDKIRGHYVRSDAVLEWHKKMKEERIGKNNPMFGKKAWNKGKTKHNNESMKEISDKLKGRKLPLDVRKKQSISAKKRKIHGHSGFKHSEETKQKIREKTLEQIKNGVFTQLKSKPHIMMASLLDSLDIKYEEEKQEGVFSYDFYLIDKGIYIEVDGDYFHSNPLFYSEGPTTKTQKINWYRDIKKKEYSEERKFVVKHFWENDIMKNTIVVKKELENI